MLKVVESGGLATGGGDKNAIVQERIIDNAGWAAATTREPPCLSVLVIFLNDDPGRLLAALDREAARLNGAVEIVVLDDGSDDDELDHKVKAAVRDLNMPAKLIKLSANEGRSKGLNRLARHSRGQYLLFLDSDMVPDAPDFLARYVQIVKAEDPDIVVGGISLEQIDPSSEQRLDYRLAQYSAHCCVSAAVRSSDPAKFVFRSNVLIRRDLFEAEPFDEGFRGWGWEDMEWGVRVSRGHEILHVDNPTTHLGLNSARIVAAKYEQSVANFGRLLKTHPDVMRGFPMYRQSRVFKAIPLLRRWRPLLKAIALAEPAPLRLRCISVQLYQIALYADALQAYEVDNSLKGKLRLCYSRVVERRPALGWLTAPMASFSFDDAPISAAEIGAQILERRGVRGTYFVSMDLAGCEGPIGRNANVAHLKRLVAHGHAIACHTYSHLNCGQASAETIADDVLKNKAALMDVGVEPPQTFAYPFGAVSPLAKRTLAPRFALLRATHRGLVRHGSDLNQAPAVCIAGTNGEAAAWRWLGRAVSEKAWLILYTHDVAEQPSQWGCTPASLERLVEGALAAGAEVVTVEEGYRRLSATSGSTSV